MMGFANQAQPKPLLSPAIPKVQSSRPKVSIFSDLSVSRRTFSRMTRKRRGSIASGARGRRNEVGEVSHLETNYSGPSFSDLPCCILVNILLRLSIKRILVCKCLCKTLYGLISDPEFAKLHFDQAEVYPLVQIPGFTLLSRLLYLVQPEHDGFERKPETLCGLTEIEPELKIRLDAKLKLPLRNFQMIDLDSEVETGNRLKLNMENHKYRIVNSCNGLLCLSDPSDNDPVIVCNPVTGEFINLPEVRTARHPATPEIACGLGFSPVTRQYKVIRMFKLGAEVNTLGTNSWKDLQSFPWYAALMDKLFTTYLNGCVYWFSPGPHGVICFDVERECFESISPPPVKRHSRAVRACMGALGGELFITEAYGLCDPVCLWVLKDHGTERAWSRIYTFNVTDEDRWPYGSYQPIKYMNDGSLVMFHSHKHALICKHPMEDEFRYWKVRGLESKVEVIAHVPSLIPLKHALSENNVEVHHIGSRCGQLKLHKETKNVYLVKEDRNSEIDTEDDEDGDML